MNIFKPGDIVKFVLKGYDNDNWNGYLTGNLYKVLKVYKDSIYEIDTYETVIDTECLKTGKIQTEESLYFILK